MRYAVALLLVLASSAIAAPPSGVDPDSETSRWYQSLTVPNTGGSCCSVADCRHYPVSSAAGPDGAPHYTVLFQGVWLPVPKEAVLDRVDNPTGAVIACINPHYYGDGEPKPNVICLIRSAGT